MDEVIEMNTNIIDSRTLLSCVALAGVTLNIGIVQAAVE